MLNSIKHFTQLIYLVMCNASHVPTSCPYLSLVEASFHSTPLGRYIPIVVVKSKLKEELEVALETGVAITLESSLRTTRFE
jgi:hypothetical protein